MTSKKKPTTEQKEALACHVLESMEQEDLYRFITNTLEDRYDKSASEFYEDAEFYDFYIEEG